MYDESKETAKRGWLVVWWLVRKLHMHLFIYILHYIYILHSSKDRSKEHNPSTLELECGQSSS